MKPHANKIHTSWLLPAAVCLLATATITFAEWSRREGDPAPGGGGSVRTFSKADWDASNYASQQDMQWFRDAKYGMFLCFGLSTHNNVDLSWHMCRTRKAPDVGSGPIPYEVWTKYPDEL